MFIYFKAEKGESVVNILDSRPLVILQAVWKIAGVGEVELVSSSAHFSNLKYEVKSKSELIMYLSKNDK